MDTGRLVLTITLFICLIEPTLQACYKAKVKNGKVKLRRRGRMVIYRCRRGFAMHGSKIAVCRHDDWSHPPPKCIGSGCPDIVPSPGLKFTPSFGNAKMTFTCDRTFELQGPTEIFCDKVSWDKPPPICQAATSALSCDFEHSEICGWKQSTMDDFDWFRNTGQTQSGYTGPAYDHTYGPGKKGYYLFIETSSPRMTGDEADLLSPEYQPEQSGQCFDLWYHMLGKSDVGSLDIFVKPESMDLDLVNSSFHQVGNQGDKWLRAEIVVPLLDEKFQIVIRGKRLESYASDIAIDDVRLYNCSEEITSTTEVISTTTVASTTTESATTATITIRTHPTTTIAPPTSAATTSRPDTITVLSTTAPTKVTTPNTTKTPVVTRTTKRAPKTTIRSQPTTTPLPTRVQNTNWMMTTENIARSTKTRRPRRTTRPTMISAKTTRRPTRRPTTTRKPRVTKPTRRPKPTQTKKMSPVTTGFTNYKNATHKPTTTSLGIRQDNKTTVYVETTSAVVSVFNRSAVLTVTTTSYSDNVTDAAGNYTEKPYLIKKSGTTKMNDLIPLAIGIGGGVFFVIIISIILVSIWAKKKKRREVEPYEELEPITKAMSKTSLNLNLVNDYNIMDNE